MHRRWDHKQGHTKGKKTARTIFIHQFSRAVDICCCLVVIYRHLVVKGKIGITHSILAELYFYFSIIQLQKLRDTM